MPSAVETIGIGVVSGALGGVLVQGTRVLFDMGMEKRRRRLGALTDLHRALYPLALDAGARAQLRLSGWESWWGGFHADLNEKVINPWYHEWNLQVKTRGVNKAMRATLRATTSLEAHRHEETSEADFAALAQRLEELLRQVRKALRASDLGPRS